MFSERLVIYKRVYCVLQARWPLWQKRKENSWNNIACVTVRKSPTYMYK
jgi:hypothetical protein